MTRSWHILGRDILRMKFVPARCKNTLWGEMGFRKIEGGHLGELQDVRETHWHFRCSEQPIRRPRPP